MKRGNKRKFNLERNKRNNLYRSLATALIDKGRIKTTVAKAKSLESFVAKLIITARKNNLTARREIKSKLGDKATHKLIKEIAPALSERPGGFTRVIRTGQRLSDGAPMAFIELLK